ncbi:MAG: DsbA family protein [Nocardiopsaceae bacterium]|nr:DsbA family protein [Nocardiopsaceae bacterium]
MGKAARQASRERLRQERLKEKQRAKRNRILGVVGAALVVVLLVVGGGYLYLTSQRESEQQFAEQYAALPPQEVQQDGSVVLAEEGAEAPVVEVYADFQCPACQEFEKASGPTLQKLAADGRAIVHYRPVSIFAQQPAPISSNSLRSAAAARAAADYGKFVQYHDILFENQPTEGTVGFAADDLKQWGEDAGIDAPAFADRIDAESAAVDQFTGEYSQQLMSAAQDEFSQQKLQGMSLGELMEWGDENGVDRSFLEDTYVKEILDATAAVNERYSGGESEFSGTPSVYVNGAKLGNEAFSGSGIENAVENAEPGQVDTEPLASDDAASGASPENEESPDAKE